MLYRRITLFALWALVFIVVTGAGVRLSGSGLGCPDWPTCQAGRVVAPLEVRPWIEFGNRLVTGLVSLAVVVAVLGSFLRTPRRRDLTWLSVGLVAGVVGQIVLGGAVVRSHLNPAVVQGHMVVSQLLVLDAVVLHHRAGRPGGPTVPMVAPALLRASRVLVGLTAAVIVAGTVVTGAGPHSGQVEGRFVERLAITPHDAARVHGTLVMALLGLVLWMVWRLRRDNAPAGALRAAEGLCTVLVLQGAIGYTQYFTGVPPLLVGLHVFGATVLWVVVVRFHLGLSEPPVGSRDSGGDPSDDRVLDDDAPSGRTGDRPLHHLVTHR